MGQSLKRVKASEVGGMFRLMLQEDPSNASNCLCLIHQRGDDDEQGQWILKAENWDKARLKQSVLCYKDQNGGSQTGDFG